MTESCRIINSQKNTLIFLIGMIMGLIGLTPSINAQAFWTTQDTVYIPGITTVQFYPHVNKLGFPLIRLGSGAEYLILEFDDMRGGFTDLLFTVVHCNADWTPSQLQKVEYIDGFEEERFRTFAYSIATFDEYTHYTMNFPNENMNVRFSGNYLLHIYQDDDDKTPVLTRRFVVAENTFKITHRDRQPTNVSKLKTHQELDITVNFKDIRVINPMNEVRIGVIQNGRWRQGIYDVPPQSVRGEELVFDYLDRIVFPAGKEFRNFDTRSIIFRTERVKEIKNLPDGVDVILHTDRSRANVKYITYPDANGRFVVDNRDRFQEPETMSEYALVHFTLDHPWIEGKDVYIMGGLCDWRLDPRFKMTYNPNKKAYQGQVMLKQGFYDYLYVTTSDGVHYDHEELEGNWAETENYYAILVYWRPFGERFDRVAALRQFNTLKR
jgi:hypothetical protein